MNADTFFKDLSPEARKNWKASYERNIGIEKGTITLYDKFKQPVKSIRMPWMLPHWERGLQMLTEVMNKLGEL